MNINLEKRIKNEKEAYSSVDIWINREKYIHKNFKHVFESKNTKLGELVYYSKISDHSNNRDVLDYGCFNGDLSPYLIKSCAKSITGIDISQEGINQAVETHGNYAKFICGDAHQTPFEDQSFDAVIGKGILHHLDYELAIKEINRLLRPGGSAIFFEPLMGGFASKKLRSLLPNTRTIDEKPISKKQVEYANGIFQSNDHHYINLITVPLGMMSTYIFPRSDNFVLNFANTIDLYLSKTFIKHYMRAVILHWVK
jgi:ubiquinone/menaquinone biosynthesis C-methylase UbiE